MLRLRQHHALICVPLRSFLDEHIFFPTVPVHHAWLLLHVHAIYMPMPYKNYYWHSGDIATADMAHNYCMSLTFQIELGFLMVGHTHEDIDQFFSKMAQYLRYNSCHTLPGTFCGSA